jgi:hypothetical protein
VWSTLACAGLERFTAVPVLDFTGALALDETIE